MTVSIRRLLAVVCWLLAGHVVLGGLYWTLLNVPESNVLALGASAALALLILIGACVVDVTGLLWLRPDRTWRASLASSLRTLPAFILALLLWVAINWLVGAIETRYEMRTGELSAWLIAKFNWTRTAWLHRAIPLLLSALRYVLGVSIAVSLLAFAAVQGFGGIIRLRWLLRALTPGSLIIIAIALTALIWLPWQYIYWRPAAIPANATEVLFNATKLTLAAILAHVGWALILWTPQRRPLT